MEPFRTCIKQIIELRELEKSQDMVSDSDTESISSDSDEITELDCPAADQKNCSPSSRQAATCRDDKYFDAIYKVIDMQPKDDVYGAFGKYIGSLLRNIAKINGVQANEIMTNLQEEVIRVRRDCVQELKLGLENRDDSIVPDIYP